LLVTKLRSVEINAASISRVATALLTILLR
jgi:hypothetical protein